MQLEPGTILNTIIGAGLVSIGALVYKAVKTLDRLADIIEGKEPPGLLIKYAQLKEEVADLRDWAISQGYERRHK